MPPRNETELRRLKPAARQARIALGLAVAEWHAQPGVPMSQDELAAFCGCTQQAIYQIERNALKKLRRRIAGDARLREAFEQLRELQGQRDRADIPAPLAPSAFDGDLGRCPRLVCGAPLARDERRAA